RLRNDFAVVDSDIDCTTNQEDFKYGEVIEFKCNGEKLSEDTKISITICWDAGSEVVELNREGDFYVGNTVIQEQNQTEVKTYINLSNENITAKTNFTFNVNTR
ncbi:hypothetical protein KC717_05995, partial [Candidatus Dojkabacteria bacterium]|nr:hypothetical protein [Candidatus Dojkabacteria bacterium]